jgi:hypothetical protein
MDINSEDPMLHGRVEDYVIEADEDRGGDWHILTFEDGWQVHIYTDQPLLTVDPESQPR